MQQKLVVVCLLNMSIVASNAFVSSKMSVVSLSMEFVTWSSKSVVPYITSVFGLILGLLSRNRNKVYYLIDICMLMSEMSEM
jgi:hypothetical protein